ncbi:MAG TPA: hypothetical protein VM222_02430 [Planctomycetota bacterium]|nr:hypothetical protein [Planctomycetota bacterium]
MRSSLLAFLILLGGPLPCIEALESADQDLVVEASRRAPRPAQRRRSDLRAGPPVPVVLTPAGREIPVPEPSEDFRHSPRLYSRPPPAA